MPVVVAPQTVSALCTLLEPICVNETPLLPGQSVSTPGVAPIPLTPQLHYSLSSNGFIIALQPNLFGTTSIGPFTGSIEVPGIGPVPYEICPTGCPVPVPPAGSVHGDVTLTLRAGADTFTMTHAA